MDINYLESLVNSNGFIKNSEAYVSIEGNLIIEVQQRNPIGRIISDNATFYIDDESKIMKTSKIYSEDPNLKQLEKSVSDKIGLRVFIKNKKNNTGSVLFEYKNLDQLNKLIDVIKFNY